jgi:hypothetical protein
MSDHKDRISVPVVSPNPKPPKPLKSAAQKAREKQEKWDADPRQFKQLCENQGLELMPRG